MNAEDHPLPAADREALGIPPFSDREAWGIPNWRDESAYPKAEGLELPEWLWEFLRRDPRYRGSWFLRDYKGPLNKEIFLLEDSPDEFDLLEWSDPRKRASDPDFVMPRFVLSQFGSPELMRVPPAGKLTLTLDLTKPTRELLQETRLQVSAAKSRNRTRPEKEVRAQRTALPKFLRLLDAVDAGATREERVRVIQKGSAEHDYYWETKALEAAKELCWWRHRRSTLIFKVLDGLPPASND